MELIIRTRQSTNLIFHSEDSVCEYEIKLLKCNRNEKLSKLEAKKCGLPLITIVAKNLDVCYTKQKTYFMLEFKR